MGAGPPMGMGYNPYSNTPDDVSEIDGQAVELFSGTPIVFLPEEGNEIDAYIQRVIEEE